MTQFDMSHLDKSYQQLWKPLPPLDAAMMEKFNAAYDELRASFNAEAVGYCLSKYINAELDYVTPGDRGIGRMSTAMPRLGAYHRKKMAALDASGRLRLYSLIEDVMLRSYLSVVLFWEHRAEHPLREAKYVDPTVVYDRWFPTIYMGGPYEVNKSEDLWVTAGPALENLMGFFSEHKMSGGLFSNDKFLRGMISFYAIAGAAIRLTETG
jgi:hypothetical protein